MISKSGQGSLRELPTELPSPSVALTSVVVPKELKSERKALSGTAVGINVLKVAKNGKLQARRVAFSSNNRSILVTSNKFKSIKGFLKALTPQTPQVSARCIDLSSIERIEIGPQTNRFISAISQHNLAPDGAGNISDDETNCFSIIYRASTKESATLVEGHLGQRVRGPHRFDTLDLVVRDNDDYLTLLGTIESLLSKYQEERKHMHTSQLFLEYHWLDLGKDLVAKISCGEWATLCDKMNLPIKRALTTSYYKDFANDLGVEDDGLTIEETAALMLEVEEATMENENEDEILDPLDAVWKELVQNDPVPPVKYEGGDNMEINVDSQEPTISPIAFLSFLRSHQKEFTTTLEQATSRIRILNAQKVLGETSEHHRLSRYRFKAYVLSDANDIFEPDHGKVGTNDMTRPLSNYWINTSHDTYLAKLPNSFRFKDRDFDNYRTVDPQMYLNVLHRGVRCIELDVFDGLYEAPVVARQKPTSPGDNSSILFSQVLNSIRSFLKGHPTSYPIIANIENHCSPGNQIVMATDLESILGSEGMLFCPPPEVLDNEPTELPSPSELRGKVIVKSKRPKAFRKQGATVMNDDFDDDNVAVCETDNSLLEKCRGDDDDDEDDDEDKGIVVHFDSNGPIKSYEADVTLRSPDQLLAMATSDATRATDEASRAVARQVEARADADISHELALSLIEEAGLTLDQVKIRAEKENAKSPVNGEPSDGDFGMEVAESPKNEGVEVQEFFEKSVVGARSEYSEADQFAHEAAEVAANALIRKEAATKKVEDAETALQESYSREKEATLAAKRAAVEARESREYADTARGRVNQVKHLVRESKHSAASAETVVVTAMTEAKISEQRASETEARASRALGTADKDRTRADTETSREERLEHEASSLHERSLESLKDARTARDKMEKAAHMLDKVNEQIKLIERSTQYQKELNEGGDSNIYHDSDTLLRGGKFLAKHAAKLRERKTCTDLIKEASAENTAAELRRRQIQVAFEEKAHKWKMQTEVASQARKQADRSAQHAEELAEHAEEEREAASLRHIAREKAQKSVSQTDDYQSSIQAQLIEASKASEEAASKAIESRTKADKLEREAEFAKNHGIAVAHLEATKKNLREAETECYLAVQKKEEAGAKATGAKRLLDTSSEVFTNAKRDAANEINAANAKRQLERSAVHAYRKALIAERAVATAKMGVKVTKEAASDKAAAQEHAIHYKQKMESVGVIAHELAVIAFFHSTKLQSWSKSQDLPSSHMHSLSFPRVAHALAIDEDVFRAKTLDFTEGHLCRIFPSWKSIHETRTVNYDPVVAQALGCQLVSMNFQSSDDHLLVNDGRFRVNGSCGYVLKTQQLGYGERPQTWRFKIIGGKCLPKGEAAMVRKNLSPVGTPCVSPFVRVSLHNGKANLKSLVHETAVATKNGFSPFWNERQDEFDLTIDSPSISTILFTVRDDEADDFIAGAAVPTSGLRQGFRSVALFDSLHSRSGAYAFASLLVSAQKLG